MKVSCCDPLSQATTMTVPCKADHGSGCAVQDAANVRQPGPSHSLAMHYSLGFFNS